MSKSVKVFLVISVFIGAFFLSLYAFVGSTNQPKSQKLEESESPMSPAKEVSPIQEHISNQDNQIKDTNIKDDYNAYYEEHGLNPLKEELRLLVELSVNDGVDSLSYNPNGNNNSATVYVNSKWYEKSKINKELTVDSITYTLQDILWEYGNVPKNKKLTTIYVDSNSGKTVAKCVYLNEEFIELKLF